MGNWHCKHNLPQMQRGFQKAQDLNLEALGFWQFIYKTVMRRFEENFWAEGFNDGASNAWNPLSPKYKAWKVKHGKYQAAMKLTGALMKSATKAAFRAMGNSCAYSWSAKRGGFDYAGFHQRGYDEAPIYKWEGNPGFGGRPITLTEEHLKDIEQQCVGYVAAKLGWF